MNGNDKIVAVRLVAFGHLRWQYKTLKVLLKYGAEISAVDKYGSTPLHLAAMNGHKGVVTVSQSPITIHLLIRVRTVSLKELLGHKAEVDSVDRSRRTPLQRAAEYGHASITKARFKEPPLKF